MTKKDKYRSFQSGPILLEQKGRQTVISSHWEKGEFESHLKAMLESHLKLKTEIQEKIDKLTKLLKNNNPFELLTILSIENSFTDPEIYTEMTHKGKESFVEFALSLILSLNLYDFDHHVTKQEIEEFKTLVEGVLNDINWFFATEASEGKMDMKEYGKRYISILRYLNIRGESYPEHHIEMIKEILTEHDKFLFENYGFKTEQIITCVNQIEKQVCKNMSDQYDFMSKMKEIHDIFLKLPKDVVLAKMEKDEFKDWFHSLPEVKAKMVEANSFKNNIASTPFLIQISPDTPASILKILSAKFGDNVEFIEYKPTPGWPTNNTIIYNKPLLCHEDKYYCFSIQVMYRNILKTVETLIKKIDENYYKTTYQEKRAKYLELTALKYLKSIMPGCEVFNGLIYDKDKELDGLIKFGNYVFLLEAKAGSFSSYGKRGTMEVFYADIKRLIGNAFEQAERAKKYISDNSVAKFYNKDKQLILEISKDKISEIFIITCSLESLSGVSTDLSFLKEKAILTGKDWPWAVFINDLRIISEIIQSPSFFIQFLQRRIRANDYSEIFSMDEMDLFMYYLNDGLYFEDGKSKNINMFGFNGYTEKLDRYYDFISGRVSTGEKPLRKISSEFLTLIDTVEKSSFKHKYECAISLLDFDPSYQSKILVNINQFKTKTLSDLKFHHFYLEILGTPKRGYNIYIAKDDDEDARLKMKHYTEMKMYERKVGECFCIGFDPDLNVIEIEFSKKEWIYNYELENQLIEFKKNKMQAIGDRKVGRNEKCPCGSNIKFKKCCGKYI